MKKTALVLGGGALTGGAWETGVVAGLAGAGLDVTGADLLLGTSAGCLLAAQLASGQTPADLYERQLAGPDDPVALRMTLSHTARYLWSVLGARTPESVGKRLGRMALASRTVPDAVVDDAVHALLGVREWPEHDRLRVTAVDALTGELGTLGRESGVPLHRAVAASCAMPGMWPPVEALGRRWIDGGVRSSVNADLAADYQRVVVLAPIPSVPGPGPDAAEQVRQLTAGGARSVLLAPDRTARRAMGRNPLDPARRPAAARAGLAQAKARLGAVAEIWKD